MSDQPQAIRDLAEVLYALGSKWCTKGAEESNSEAGDVGELVKVLSRLVKATPTARHLHTVFGAPGDWGYGTPIGDALRRVYESPRDPANAEAGAWRDEEAQQVRADLAAELSGDENSTQSVLKRLRSFPCTVMPDGLGTTLHDPSWNGCVGHPTERSHQRELMRAGRVAVMAAAMERMP